MFATGIFNPDRKRDLHGNHLSLSVACIRNSDRIGDLQWSHLSLFAPGIINPDRKRDLHVSHLLCLHQVSETQTGRGICT